MLLYRLFSSTLSSQIFSLHTFWLNFYQSTFKLAPYTKHSFISGWMEWIIIADCRWYSHMPNKINFSFNENASMNSQQWISLISFFIGNQMLSDQCFGVISPEKSSLSHDSTPHLLFSIHHVPFWRPSLAAAITNNHLNFEYIFEMQIQNSKPFYLNIFVYFSTRFHATNVKYLKPPSLECQMFQYTILNSDIFGPTQ